MKWLRRLRSWLRGDCCAHWVDMDVEGKVTIRGNFYLRDLTIGSTTPIAENTITLGESTIERKEEMTILTVPQAQNLIRDELRRARQLHQPFHSAHEAYAVMLEEMDEFWTTVKENHPSREELIQVGAMVLATLTELLLYYKKPLSMHDGQATG